MTKSADPDQLVSSEATRSGSTLFAKMRHDLFSKRRVNCDTKIHTFSQQPFQVSQHISSHQR